VPLRRPAHVAHVVNTLGRYVQWSMTRLSTGTSAFHQRITSNDSYAARDEQGDNPRQEKEGSTVMRVLYNL